MEVPHCVLFGSGFLWKTVLVKKKHERFEVYKKDSGEIVTWFKNIGHMFP